MYKVISTFLTIFLIFNTPIQSSDIEHEYWPETPEEYVSEDNGSYSLEVREVAVDTTIYVQLHQFFTYDGSIYNGIEYSEFSKKYSQLANKYIDQALKKSKLDQSERNQTDTYTVVGEQDVHVLEPLYDCQRARDTLINLVTTYIDKNHDRVRAACVGVPLQESRSKVVWAPGCCDIQLHKDCFKQCKQNNIHACLNSFCTNRDWNDTFYAACASKKHYVHLTSIRDTDCPLCMEPLLVDTSTQQENTTKKRGCTDIVDDTVRAKKSRFL